MRTVFVFITAIAISLLTALSANSAERHIHVNGDHLTPEQIEGLDHLANQRVGDGFYWINSNTGAWGHEGNQQIQGRLDLSRLQNRPAPAAPESPAPAPQGATVNAVVGAWMNRRNASNGIYIESTTKWVFSVNGTVAWGSGTVIAGGAAGVSLRGGGENPPDFGRWSVEGEILRVNWNDGTSGQWRYSVFDDYNGNPTLALTGGNGKPLFLRKIN